MIRGEKRAIISVANKEGLVEFMDGLESEWEMYGTKGTQEEYYDGSGIWIQSLSDLVAEELGVEIPDREVVAKRVSEIMLVKNSVQLACLNLRAPRLEPLDETGRNVISLDDGGISMITSAGNSGALVVTHPETYGAVLTKLKSGGQIAQEFYQTYQMMANEHIEDHLVMANSLG
jgi:AICAR transformylase/IMP cyclohydrolase PurH